MLIGFPFLSLGKSLIFASLSDSYMKVSESTGDIRVVYINGAGRWPLVVCIKVIYSVAILF